MIRQKKLVNNKVKKFTDEEQATWETEHKEHQKQAVPNAISNKEKELDERCTQEILKKVLRRYLIDNDVEAKAINEAYKAKKHILKTKTKLEDIVNFK